jgi:hypothetical protein
MYFDVVGICMGVSIHNKDSFMIMNKRMLFFAPLIRRWINSSFFWTWQSQALLSYERAGQTESISDEGMFTSFKLPFENTQITSLFGICGVIIRYVRIITRFFYNKCLHMCYLYSSIAKISQVNQLCD